MSTRKVQRGGALLAVLWLSAALAAIAFALANTVHGETERASTAVDGLRSGYLAEAAVKRAILYMDWGRMNPDNARFKIATPVYSFDFPEGHADVEVISESAKLSLNASKAEDLASVLAALNVPGEQAREIAAAIADWRTPSPGAPTGFDAFYQSLAPPYISRHAPFTDGEELLAVKGITPELYHGSWEPTPEGAGQRLVARPGLRDCVSVFGTVDQFDANSAPRPVLAAIGVPQEGIDAIIQRRREKAFHVRDDLSPLAEVAGQGFQRLGVGGRSIFTLRATARLKLPTGQLSDLRRTVGAMVKLMPPGYDSSYHILRWYDSVTPNL